MYAIDLMKLYRLCEFLYRCWAKSFCSDGFTIQKFAFFYNFPKKNFSILNESFIHIKVIEKICTRKLNFWNFFEYILYFTIKNNEICDQKYSLWQKCR